QNGPRRAPVHSRFGLRRGLSAKNLRCWQSEVEATSLSHFALQPKLSTVQFHEAARNARAGILNLYPDPVVLQTSPKFDTSTLRSELDGISHQVHHNLFEANKVGGNIELRCRNQR